MLKALADETRWRIMRELLKGPHSVGELVQRTSVSQYNISKHVRILREAGMVMTEREGKRVQCRVTDAFCKQGQGEDAVLDLGCCNFRFD